MGDPKRGQGSRAAGSVHHPFQELHQYHLPRGVRNLRKATALLKQAGFEIKGNRMVDTTTGTPFTIEIMLNNRAQKTVVLPYVRNLQSIGIEVRVTLAEPLQYTKRTNAFDYDMTWEVWGQTLTPGNEQADYWGSAAATRDGSRNYAGISDPGVDALIQRVIFTKGRGTLFAATKALDRVLLAHNYVIPLYSNLTAQIAYWDKLARPQELPKYGLCFPGVWWWKSAASHELVQGRQHVFAARGKQNAKKNGG
ncbi:ABC transporter substrate-binding protein [Sinorhizobium alkalisoli]|uniref:ABC transporter substrate-binding protein n=1 Tax=Sinorhizobium alkalisoli TaxID=1752398 RepID=UPI001FD8D8BD|nr:ABC transporter substrate-binding protein [Sinorhizobium alkalisoli]